MNAAVRLSAAHGPGAAAHGTATPARLALLGTGTVGSAVLERLTAWQGTAFARRLQLVHVANSKRRVSAVSGLDPGSAPARLEQAGIEDDEDLCDVLRGKSDVSLRAQAPCIVIDATASDAVADRHAAWLSRGIHVVTACKLGQGTDLSRWRAIRDAQRLGGARYGDSATVGAGLPLLSSIRRLRDGGDHIHAIAGVLSGSMAWLFHHYDGLRPFSGFVREARDAGYTEPDPRDDLSGEDIKRKLLILSRAAGVELDSGDVEVTSPLPPALAALPAGEVDAGLSTLDAPMRLRFAQAYKRGEKLRFIARLEHGVARVGLEALAADHPLAAGGGTDNRVAIWSDRYREQPLVIQGPGAGAEVTAAALLDDVMAILSSTGG